MAFKERSVSDDLPSGPSGSRSDEPGTLNALADNLSPDTRDLPTKKRIKVIVLSAAVSLAVVAATIVGTYAFDLWTTESKTRAGTEAERGIDLARAPFIAHVSEVDVKNFPLDYALDRPLADAELKHITEFTPERQAELVPYLRTLGGYFLRDGPYFLSTRGKYLSEFNLQMHSDRQSQITITDMRPKVIDCQPSTGVAVISVPPDGVSAYTGLLFDLAAENPEAIIVDETDNRGSPFFASNVINLGGGAEPANLRVQSLTSHEACEWEIEVEYADSTGEHTSVIQNGDVPFRSEALPRDADQHWEWQSRGGGTWVNCRINDNAVCLSDPANR
ncbi:hypothetical protein [Streptomyces niveus]|uniref:hypothetical protein n=1 Tax=Streptomyces niveus TaxID=193462 RepID=UPI003419BF07